MEKKEDRKGEVEEEMVQRRGAGDKKGAEGQKKRTRVKVEGKEEKEGQRGGQRGAGRTKRKRRDRGDRGTKRRRDKEEEE